MRVRDVKVGRLTARVVHAHELEAAAGNLGRVLPPDPEPQIGAHDLSATELSVDVLYARDIKAGLVHIEETHARVKGKDRGDQN
jgi:hypothetical protein